MMQMMSVYLWISEKNGDRFSITGQPPFRITLGYSPGVELIFNNKRFDIEPFSKYGVARFQIPQ